MSLYFFVYVLKCFPHPYIPFLKGEGGEKMGKKERKKKKRTPNVSDLKYSYS